MLETEKNFTTLSSTEATLTDVLSQMVLKRHKPKIPNVNN